MMTSALVQSTLISWALTSPGGLLFGSVAFSLSMKCSFLDNIWKVNCTSHSQSLFEFFLVLLSLSCNRSDVKEETCLSKILLSGNTCSVALSPWSLCFIPFESIHCLSFWGFVMFFGGFFVEFFFPEGRGINHHLFFCNAEHRTQDFKHLSHLLYPCSALSSPIVWGLSSSTLGMFLKHQALSQS